MKKSKKGKKNKRKIVVRRIKILLLLLAVTFIIIFILKSTNGTFGLTESMKVIDKYMSCLNEENEEKYDKMYDMLSESSRKNITKEDFIARNEEIYGQIEASNITVSDMKEEVQDNRKNKSYIYKQNGNNCRNINFWKYCKI